MQPFPNVDDGRWQISQGGGNYPNWGPDGTELFYYISPGTLVRVPVETSGDFVAGSPEVLFEGPYPAGNDGRHYDVSPDGRFLLLKRGGTDEEEGDGPTVMFVDNWFQELLERVPVD